MPVVINSRPIWMGTMRFFLSNRLKMRGLRLGTKTPLTLWSSAFVTSSTTPTSTLAQTPPLTKICLSISNSTISRFYRWDSRTLALKLTSMEHRPAIIFTSNTRLGLKKQTMMSSWWEGLQTRPCFTTLMYKLLTRTRRMKAMMKTRGVKMSRSLQFLQGNSHRSRANRPWQWVIMLLF